MTTREIRALFARWQKQLRMRDWDLALELVPGECVDEPGLHGTALDIELHDRTARVIVYLGCEGQDPEATIVHELIEIALSPFDLPEDERKEQIINAVARALVDLARLARSRRRTR